MQRSAEKGDVAADRLSAGKPADRLIDHRLERWRQTDLRLGSPLIDQRLDIGFGKDAAARGDRSRLP